MSAVQRTSPNLASTFQLQHILVLTDFSEYSNSALKQASAIARLHGSDLLVLHVVPPEPIVNAALEPATWENEIVIQRAREEMEALKKENLFEVQCEHLVETGPLQSVVTSIVKERDISLIVIGTHGRTGVRKCILGSIAETIFRVASCPVITIGPDIEPTLLTIGRFKSVLFATDFSEGSKHALPYAIGLAQESGAQLTLMHVIEEGSFASLYLHDELARNARVQLTEMVPSCAGLSKPPNIEVVSGYPVEQILRVARKNVTDLIVMGVHKSTGFSARTSAHLPWTIASTIVCHAKCPVLTVRG